MASVVVEKGVEKPVSRSMPNSIGAQSAIFWSGIFLTSLVLISSLGQLLRSGGDVDLLVILQFISVATSYCAYLWMRSHWSKPFDELRLETLADVSLIGPDPQVTNQGPDPKKVMFGMLIAGILFQMILAILEDRMSLMPFIQLSMIPLMSIPICFNQPPRLRIVSSGLLWEMPTSTFYFPWRIVDSVRLVNGATLDRLQWTAPGRWGKPFNYETKIVKLSDEEREKFLSVIGERVGVMAGREVA